MDVERNMSLDLLRSIGLLCIILAHVNPPAALFQLRTFDVILLVAVSTLSYTEYSRPKPYLQYLTGRFKRLLLPTWEYILLVGAVFFGIAVLTGTETAFPLKRLLVGALTMSSVGYLWIIRVYLYNALINPFIPRLKNVRCGLAFCCLLAAYAGYSLLSFVCMGSAIPHFSRIAEATLLDFFGYGIIAAASFILYHLPLKRLISVAAILCCSLVAVTIGVGAFVPNTYKYPPMHQYVLWGLLVVALSFYIVRKFPVKRLPCYLVFLSKNSLWVYFWHLIMINVIKYYPDLLPGFIVGKWWVQFLTVVAFASLMCRLQNLITAKCVFHTEKKTKNL